MKVDVYYRHQSGDFGLAIEGRPDTTMFFIGEEVSLLLSAKEELVSAPLFYHWYQVNDDFDGEKGYDLSGVPQLVATASDNRIYEIDLSNELPSAYVMQPEDSASYYVVVGDGVCPAVATNLVKVDVMSKLATAFTPYVKDGYNDLFLERHHVVIFDRYGQKVYEGDNGWDGTKSGILVDPGVYFYTAQMKNGTVMNGSIEVVYNK
jgi:gliding motility-associated-like protein